MTVHFRTFAQFLVLAVLALGVVTPALAQDNAGITLIPAYVEKRIDPGTLITETLKITNESSTEREFYIYTRDIKGVEAGGVPLFAEEGLEPTGYELSTWVTLPGETIVVPADDFVEFPISIQVPDDASPGSHFGGVFISQEPPRLRQTGAGVGYEVVSVLSLRVNGDVVDTARIRSFSTDKLVYGEKNVTFNIRVENQGNILIRPFGPMTIRSMFGTEPDTATVNESLAGVFPGTMRDFTHTWTSDSLGFGRYEAILAMVYDGEEGQKTIDATTVFWIFPTKVVLSILAGFVLIFGLGYFLTRYYVNQAIMRAQGGRRIVSPRSRRGGAVSRTAFVFLSVMVIIVMFLLVLLVFFA